MRVQSDNPLRGTGRHQARDGRPLGSAAALEARIAVELAGDRLAQAMRDLMFAHAESQEATRRRSELGMVTHTRAALLAAQDNYRIAHAAAQRAGVDVESVIASVRAEQGGP